MADRVSWRLRLLTAGTATATAAIIASSGLTAGAATTRAAGTGAASAAARTVLLINGDRFAATPAAAGGRSMALLPSPGGSVLRLHRGRLDEAIPADALPYLGHGLDPSLFNLTALERAEAGGRLPVQVTFTGHRPALPGVTITRSGRGSASGYLTASSARTFGAALARQFRADHGRASYGTDGVFADGVSISLAGTRTAAPARPDFPMHTLTVTATNLRGQPDTGDVVFIFNLDDPDAFGLGPGALNAFYHGTAKFSLPAGRYWGFGDFFGPASEHWVVLPQFTVRGSDPRLRLAERAATSELAAATPRPTDGMAWTLTLLRGGPRGSGAPMDFSDFGSSTPAFRESFWINPTAARPTVGTLQWYTYLQLLSATTMAGTPYAYDLDYAGPAGRIPSLGYRVTAGRLATVSEHYYQDVRTTGLWSTTGAFPAQAAAEGGAWFFPLRLPGRQTQYMLANPDLTWESQYLEFASSYSGGQYDAPHALRAGQQVTEDWNEFPLHPQPDVSLLHGRAARSYPTFPSAFRAGNTLSLTTTPFSDNQLGHAGYGFTEGEGQISGTYAIDQNGVTLARGNAVNGIPRVRLTAKPSVIRFTLAAARQSSSYLLSSASTTTWTWRSARQPRAAVPAGWYCGQTGTGKLLRACAVQPMLTLNYHVHGLALDGAAPAGRQVIDLTVGHLQLAAAAPASRAAAQVSLNDGQNWEPAAVTAAGSGKFTITFSAPAGVDVTLRVTAANRAGDSVTETILRGYRVGT